MTIMARKQHEFGTGERLMEKVHQRSSQRVNSPIFRTRRDTQKGDERTLVVGWTHPEMLYAGAFWTHWPVSSATKILVMRPLGKRRIKNKSASP